MEINDENVQAIVHYLQATLMPDTMQEAEDFLRSVEENEGYGLLLLHTVQLESVDAIIRQQAAITLKNYLRRLWPAEPSRITDAERTALKAQIVDAMVGLPAAMQRQLSEGIAIIGKRDFPYQWEELLPSMVSKFDADDFNAINGILQTAQPLFRRYRFQQRSDELWTEIKYVLEIFAAPLTVLFNTTLGLVEANAGNAENLRTLFDSLRLICKLFYSLNFQDLPAFFEDHMGEWMAGFGILLEMPDVAEHDEGEETATPLCEIKAQVCTNVALYASKYDEDFGEYLSDFVQRIWTLLTGLGLEVKYDRLVSTGIQFLASVAERFANQSLFEDPTVQQNICEKVIVPNMHFRDADEVTFEDDAEEYIRRDIEGSDVDTRRRGACDLVRSLCKFWEERVTGVFTEYVQALLGQYAADPGAHWRSKDAAIFLITALAVRARTSSAGATKTNELIDVVDFFHTHIAPHLQDPDMGKEPVLRADSLKFAFEFRQQLPNEVHHALLPLLQAHLLAPSPVVASYAAVCIDRILSMRRMAPEAAATVAAAGSARAASAPVFDESVLAPHVEGLLTACFTALEQEGQGENEYIMKAIMRIIAVGRSSVQPYLAVVVERLSQIVLAVAKNPSRPRFNHFLFESVSCAVRYTCAADPSAATAFAAALMPAFGQLLTGDVEEFQPYVFQILAQLLDAQPPPLAESHIELFPFLLNASLWDNTANTTPLVSLLSAYMRKGAPESVMSTTDALEGVLGIFQKLMASRLQDHEGFRLLDAVACALPRERIEPYAQTVATLWVNRLQSSATEKLMRCMLASMGVLVASHGIDMMVAAFDALQPRLFDMVMRKLCSQAQKISDSMQKKTACCGLVHMLAGSEMVLVQYSDLWPVLLTTVVKLFELPEEASVTGENDAAYAAMDGESGGVPGGGGGGSGYKASFNRLNYAGDGAQDPFVDVADPRVLLATQLYQLAQAHPGQLAGMVPAEVAPTVQTYLEANGIANLP